MQSQTQYFPFDKKHSNDMVGKNKNLLIYNELMIN